MEINDILKAFFPEYIDDDRYQLTSSREAQYNQFFSKEEMGKFYDISSKDDVRLNELSSDYMNRLLRQLIQYNDKFNSLDKTVSIAMIKSNDNSTCYFTYKDNRIILFDRNTMTFYWMLDKAFLYDSKIDSKKQILLFVEIMLHFLSKKFNLGTYPKPITPPHTSKEKLANLVMIVEIQESFMLAHEMAHIIANSDIAVNNHIDFINDFFDTMHLNVSHEGRIDICQELEADRIAFIALLNTYAQRKNVISALLSQSKNTKLIFEIVSSAIFLVIRYNLWLSIAGHELFKLDDDWNTWLVRNSFFRNLVDNQYTYGPAVYIIQLLEKLEESLEPAALIVSKVIKDYLETNTK